MNSTKIAEISAIARPFAEKIVRFLAPQTPSNTFPNIVTRLMPTIEKQLIDLMGRRWTVIRWGAYDFFYPGVEPQAALLRFGTTSNMSIDDMLKAAKMKALKVFQFDEPEGLMLSHDRSIEFEGVIEVNDVLFKIDNDHAN